MYTQIAEMLVITSAAIIGSYLGSYIGSLLHR